MAQSANRTERREASGPARLVLAIANAQRRFVGAILSAVGPDAARAVTALLARALYRLLPGMRERSEAHCRAALGSTIPEPEVVKVAEQSFVHRIWNHVDLLLADRWLRPDVADGERRMAGGRSRASRVFADGCSTDALDLPYAIDDPGTSRRPQGATLQRHSSLAGARIPQPLLVELLEAQERGQAAILITAYYGPFDLLPPLLAFHGVRAGVVYRPHGNADFDAFRNRIRGRGGCELIPESQAAARLGQILGAGGAVALVADHPAGRRGVPVTFLGIPTHAKRTVGLLAWRHQADVVVAGIRRRARGFSFELIVTDIIRHSEWRLEEDEVGYVTRRYLRGLESIIRSDPTQYPWGYARWGEG